MFGFGNRTYCYPSRSSTFCVTFDASDLQAGHGDFVLGPSQRPCLQPGVPKVKALAALQAVAMLGARRTRCGLACGLCVQAAGQCGCAVPTPHTHTAPPQLIMRHKPSTLAPSQGQSHSTPLPPPFAAFFCLLMNQKMEALQKPCVSGCVARQAGFSACAPTHPTLKHFELHTRAAHPRSKRSGGNGIGVTGTCPKAACREKLKFEKKSSLLFGNNAARLLCWKCSLRCCCCSEGQGYVFAHCEQSF